jgi:hypothetical protein
MKTIPSRRAPLPREEGGEGSEPGERFPLARSTVVGAESLPSIRAKTFVLLIPSVIVSISQPWAGGLGTRQSSMVNTLSFIFSIAHFKATRPTLKWPTPRPAGDVGHAQPLASRVRGRWVIQTRVEPKTKNQGQRAKARFSPKSKIRLEPISNQKMAGTRSGPVFGIISGLPAVRNDSVDHIDGLPTILLEPGNPTPHLVRFRSANRRCWAL